MDKRMFLYHPVRWKGIHKSSDLERMFRPEFPAELTDMGMTKLEYNKIREEHAWFLSTCGAFQKTGSNIFHLQPTLVEMLKNSSVDEIRVDSIKTPFEMIYVYFGSASGVKLEGQESSIDGAYVWNTQEEDGISLSITLTQELEHEGAMQLPWLQRLAKDRQLHFNLDAPNGSDLTVKQAFDNLFKNPYGAKESLEDFETALSDSWVPDPKYREPAMRPILNLICNALCYLAYQNRDVVTRYPEYAPERLVKQATIGATDKERKRGKSKLEAIGFNKVSFCGETIEKRISQQQTRVGGEVSSHWRRGHWRHQAHGVGMSLRKLLWIEPVLVKEGAGETGGHVYVPMQALAENP